MITPDILIYALIAIATVGILTFIFRKKKTDDNIVDYSISDRVTTGTETTDEITDEEAIAHLVSSNRVDVPSNVKPITAKTRKYIEEDDDEADSILEDLLDENDTVEEIAIAATLGDVISEGTDNNKPITAEKTFFETPVERRPEPVSVSEPSVISEPSSVSDSNFDSNSD